jgi:hypothetical protein
MNAIAAVVATCAEEQHEDILLAKASVPDREQALFCPRSWVEGLIRPR